MSLSTYHYQGLAKFTGGSFLFQSWKPFNGLRGTIPSNKIGTNLSKVAAGGVKEMHKEVEGALESGLGLVQRVVHLSIDERSIAAQGQPLEAAQHVLANWALLLLLFWFLASQRHTGCKPKWKILSKLCKRNILHIEQI
jgi:hypothetical protein